MRGFKPLKYDFAKIHMTGGLAFKSMPLTSKTIHWEEEQENITFVKMASSETWLVMATTGYTKHASLGRTSLLEDLRLEIQKLCDGEESSFFPCQI